MNIEQTLARIFPSGVVRACSPERGGQFEVHGLRRGTAPENCEVLAGGIAPTAPGEAHCDRYLVRTDDFILFFEVFPAAHDSGHDDVVQSCGYASVDDACAHELQAFARKSIEMLQ